MSPELINTIGTIAGIIVAALGAFLFAFWIALGIWTFHDIRNRTRDWLVIVLAVTLVLIFPLIGLILYLLIRPKATLADVYDRALEEEALLREIEQTQSCPGCGVPVKEVWVYCPNCHTQLQHSCAGCGNLVRNEWDICVFCGATQLTAGQPKLAARPQSAPAGQPAASSAAQAVAAPAESAVTAGTVQASAGRAYRSPFQRGSAPSAVPPATSTTPPTTPTTTLPGDLDDSAFRPAQMPD